mgnify:CR=1 FL=1
MLQALPVTALTEELYAAVDLGSNSFHMVIVKVVSGSVQIVSKNKQKVRLAAGLDENNYLSASAIERGLACLRTFQDKVSDIPSDNIRIVATATLRFAVNANDFLTQAQAILGKPIEVISGEEEAKHIYLGVAYTSANQGNSLVIDIGGASTEIIVGRDMQALHLVSTEMGCVTYMERYFPDGTLKAENFEQAIHAAKKQLAQHAATFLCFDWQQCLGASGTPQAIVSILVKQGINDAIKLDYLYKLKNECIAQANIEKLSILGLDESRRAIFPSGLAILIALFESLSIKDMHIAGGALREGILYGMLDNYQHSDRRSQGIKQLVSKFHIDPAQSNRTAKAAITLCRQMCEQDMSCDLETEALVHAAAALHEIGLHIAYKNFELHGAYILEHVPITGFTQLQKDSIKDLIKLHRLDIDLTALNAYSEQRRAHICKCLRILRIAVVLCTRRKDQAVLEPRLEVNGSDWTLNFDDYELSHHRLLEAELIQESWYQHKAGWKLSIA